MNIIDKIVNNYPYMDIAFKHMSKMYSFYLHVKNSKLWLFWSLFSILLGLLILFYLVIPLSMLLIGFVKSFYYTPYTIGFMALFLVSFFPLTFLGKAQHQSTPNYLLFLWVAIYYFFPNVFGIIILIITFWLFFLMINDK